MPRRLEIRRKLELPIEVISSSWDEPLTFEASDLSPRGAFVETELLPSVGEHLVCSFALGRESAFDFFAEVVRVNLMRRASDGRLWPGFGVRFLDARPLERIRIRDALRRTPPAPTMRRPPQRISTPTALGRGEWDRSAEESAKTGEPFPPRLPRLR